MKDIMGVELKVNDKVIVPRVTPLGEQLLKGTITEINRDIAYVRTDSRTRDERCTERDRKILKFDWTENPYNF